MNENNLALNRRGLLGSLAAGASVFLAGCGGIVGGSQRSSDTSPETSIGVNQSRGAVSTGNDDANTGFAELTFAVEFIHEGGVPIDPDRLSLRVNDDTLAESALYSWETLVNTERSIENIEGMFTEGDSVAVRAEGNDPSMLGAGAESAETDTLRLFWNSSDSDSRTVLKEYVVQRCLDGKTFDPSSRQCTEDDT